MKMSVCLKCKGERKIKTLDPVLFRPQWNDCTACIDEVQELETIANLATAGFVWADFDLSFDFWK
jgi:hypothetical protein